MDFSGGASNVNRFSDRHRGSIEKCSTCMEGFRLPTYMYIHI